MGEEGLRVSHEWGQVNVTHGWERTQCDTSEGAQHDTSGEGALRDFS